MLDAATGLVDRAALDAEDDVPRGLFAEVHHRLPVNHAVAAGTAHGGAGDLAALGRWGARGRIITPAPPDKQPGCAAHEQHSG